MRLPDSQNFKAAPFNEAEMLRRIGSGNAVLFVGSGFAFNAKSVTGLDAPDAKGLANAIGTLGGFDGEGDLRYAADRYMRSGDSAALVNMLIDRFTLVDDNPNRGEVASAGWRRIYTTNYDLLVERSAEGKGRLIKSVDVTSPATEYWQQNDICVHLNGSIRTVSKDTLNSSFKLSNSSYLSPESFLTSDWSFPFKKDLDLASAIVFVGYSLYDIEIQKFLHSSPELREKTYFVTRIGETERNIYTFSNYGQVLPIGMDALASIFKTELAKHRRTAEEVGVRSFVKYAPATTPWSARDADVDKMLMHGDIPDSAFDSAISTENTGAPIIIMREALSQARRLLSGRKHLVVVSDFGNGKSMFLRELKSQLALEGADVYSVETDDDSNFADLELIVKATTPTYLFIDNYDAYLDLIRSFGALAPAHVKLVLSARATLNERNRQHLGAAHIECAELAVDELSSEDIDGLIRIFDNAGLWGSQAHLSRDAKVAHIQERGAQLSLVLLSIIESPQMIDRVRGLLEPLVSVAEYRDTIFAISLLQVLNVPLTSALVSEVAMNDSVYTPELRSNSNFMQLFRVNAGRISARSSLFSLALIRNQFQPSYIVDQLLRIVDRFDGRDRFPDKDRIFKDLLRFSVVERLLPDKNKKTNLLRYYEELKRHAEWLVRNPHFWLQYAMTQMQFEEYAKAQKFLDQAYALARNREDYHTVQIDTQQARMWLEQASKAEAPGAAYELFEKANILLKSVPNDMHKFWQLHRYRLVYEKQYVNFSKGQQAYFEQASKNCIADITRALSGGLLPFADVQRAEMVRRGLTESVDRIKTGRLS